jgi:hypothetical protein
MVIVQGQTPSIPIRINCGSTSSVIMNDILFHSDQYSLSGAMYNTCGNTTTNSIYCTSRYFRTSKGTPFQYNIPVPFNNTFYQLRLHFAEQVRSFTTLCLCIVQDRFYVCSNCAIRFLVSNHFLSLVFLFLVNSLKYIQFHNRGNLRLFDIYVEGSLVINDLDIITVAPGKNVPYIVSLNNTFVNDGTMTIDFINLLNDPQINGIEILLGNNQNPPKSSPVTVPIPVIKAPTKSPIIVPVPTKVPASILQPVPATVPVGTTLYRINCGSTTSAIMNKVTFHPDQYSLSGAMYNTCGNTTNNIYCTSRYFRTTKGTPFRYNFPVPYNNASYQLRLHFAEQVRYIFLNIYVAAYVQMYSTIY